MKESGPEGKNGSSIGLDVIQAVKLGLRSARKPYNMTLDVIVEISFGDQYAAYQNSKTRHKNANRLSRNSPTATLVISPRQRAEARSDKTKVQNRRSIVFRVNGEGVRMEIVSFVLILDCIVLCI